MPSLADRGIFFAFVALIFLVPIVAPTSFATGPVAPDFYKAFSLQVGTLLLIAGWCVAYTNRHNAFHLQFTNWHIAVCLLLLWCTLSLFWAFHLNLGQIALSRWLAFGAVFLLASQLITDTWRVQVVLAGLLFSGLCVTIIGICQFFKIPPLDTLFLQAAPPSATFGNRNMAMHFVILTLPLAGWFFVSCKEQWQVFCAALAGALMVTYIFYSGNRTSLIALALQITLLVVAVVCMKRKKSDTTISQHHVVSFICALCLTLVLINLTADGWRWVWDYLVDRYFNLDNYARAEHTSFKARLFLWYNSWYMFLDHLLFGVGFGNWTVHYPFYTGNHALVATMMTNNPASTILYKQAHNEYVQLVTEVGLVGTVLMLFCLVLWILGVGRLLGKVRNHPFAWCWVFLIISIAGVSVSAMASFPFRVSVPLMTLACYLAILQFFCREQKDTNTGKTSLWSWISHVQTWHVSLPKTAAWSLALFCLLGAVAVGMTYSKWIEAHKYRNLSASYLLGGKIDKSLEMIKKSIRRNPADPDDGYYIMGNLYKRKKLYSQAIETYNHALATSLPYHPYMFTQLHLAHLLNRQPEMAIATLKRAISLMPEQDGYYAYLGSLYGSLGRAEEAINYYKRTLQINPKHPKAKQMQDIVARHEASQQKATGQ